MQVIRNVLAVLRLMVDPSDPAAGRRAFKALYGEEKEERKKAVDYVEKVGDPKTGPASSIGSCFWNVWSVE